MTDNTTSSFAADSRSKEVDHRKPAKVISTHRAAPPTHTAAAKNNTVRETELDTRPPVKMTLLVEIAGRFGQIFKVS